MKRRRELAVAVAVLHFCTACYVYVPAGGAPNPGARLAVQINDEGRVALRDLLGPGVVRLEGTLEESASDALVIRTVSIVPIGGRPLPVDSVRVRVEHRHASTVNERRLSRSRTWTAIGVGVTIAAAFLLTGGFSGRGTPPELPPGEPPVNQFRGVP